MRFSLAAAVLCIALASLTFGQSAPTGAQESASPIVATDYVLGPEDVIQVTVYKECPELCVDSMVVRPDGKVSIPLVGELTATGKSARQLQNEITAKLTDCCLSEPNVNVIVKEVNSAKVSVLGEVKKPDKYKIGARTTVLEIIALAGGFTEYAKKGQIRVKRSTPDGEQDFKFDLDQLMKANKRSNPFYLMPHDLIYVP